MCIIVEFMVCTISPIFKVHYYRLKIPPLIFTIHHVYQIELVYILIFIIIISLISTKGNQTSWKYTGVSLSSKSALTILADSLQPNRTYQWMVYMENHQNSSLQATGYVLVRVENTLPKMIAIG